MFKFSRLICALCVCCCVGFAYGKAIKIKSIVPLTGTLEAENGADGMAIFNPHPTDDGQGATEFTIAITDFIPGETYDVFLVPGASANLEPQIANAAGNANWTGDLSTALCTFGGSIRVIIYQDMDGNGSPFVTGTDILDLNEAVAEGDATCP